MFFIKLILIYIKNYFLYLIKFFIKKIFIKNSKEFLIKKPDSNLKKNLKDENLKLELIFLKLIPLTFHYEPLLFNIKENNNLEDFNLKNKFKTKFILLNSRYIKLNNLLLNFYKINILKKKKNININLHYIQLTTQERNKIFNYYNSDLLFIKNSFIFYEDDITLNKKKYLSNYIFYKKYGFGSYSENLFSSNETKITNISSYSFRLEDGGTVSTWTSFIFNDSMKFLFFFYIPYIFYSYLQFTFLYILIILLISSDFTIIFKNYLIYSSSEYSLLNLILYKILFDNSLLLFFQNLFLNYFDFLIKFFYPNTISIYIQIFLVILFFLVLFFWLYENIINLLLLDFFSIYLKNKDVASEEISSFVDDFLNEDTTEEIRDVHMPMTFSDNNLPHKEGDSFYDIPRGTDYQKFVTPFFTIYLFFVAIWNYLFLFLFFYIFYIFWSDFDFFIYILKFSLFKFLDFTNLNSFFYYNIDFDFFSYLPFFYYILPFLIILFIITFSLKFSGFTYLYEDLYVKYKLKTEKGFYIYYNLFKTINFKTLFINLFSTKSVYYIDRNLISNKNTNIFFFCLNMFFIFLKPLKNILILLLLLLLVVYILNFIIALVINMFILFIFFLKIILFLGPLINIKLVFFFNFLIFYSYLFLFFIKIFFYSLFLFYFLIFLFKINKYFYLFILNIFHFSFLINFSIKVKQNIILLLCLNLILFRLLSCKFIYFYLFFILFFFITYFFIKMFYRFLYHYIFYKFNYIRFLFIKIIIDILKYKFIINLLFFSLILFIILKYLLLHNILIKFLVNFFIFYLFINPYFILLFSNFIFFLFFFLHFFTFFILLFFYYF